MTVVKSAKDSGELAAEVKFISLENVSKAFATDSGCLTALERVSLQVRQGEFLSVIGPSGCGKTTLLRIIAGLEEPTCGQVTFPALDTGKPMTSMVFQGVSVFPWMTVRENIAYGLRIRGATRHHQRDVANHFIQRTGLAGFENSYPHQLSEGMRQRVSVARAFANDPHVLLMDEPFANLDEQNRSLMQEELLRLWESTSKAVIFVTHSIQEAVLLSDRVAVLTKRPGRVKEVITVPFERPRRMDALIGTPEFTVLTRRLWSVIREEVLDSRQGVNGHKGRRLL